MNIYQMKPYLLDVTTLITLISDISNDRSVDTRFGEIEKWAEVSDDIYRQVLDEQRDPILPKLLPILEKSEWVVIEPIWTKVVELIENLGSESEYRRMLELRPKLRIVETGVLEDVDFLKGRLWDNHDELNRKVIATLVEGGYTFITGNQKMLMSFFDRVHPDDIEFDYTVHRARCFVGGKYTTEYVKIESDGTVVKHWDRWNLIREEQRKVRAAKRTDKA